MSKHMVTVGKKKNIFNSVGYDWQVLNAFDFTFIYYLAMSGVIFFYTPCPHLILTDCINTMNLTSPKKIPKGTS